MRTAWPLKRRHLPRLALACALVVFGATAVVLATPAGQAAAGVSPGVTQRASVSDNGAQAPEGEEGSGVEDVAISGNGRYEAFDDIQPLTPSSDSVPENTTNIFVRDLKAPGHTALISRGIELPETNTSSDVHIAQADADPPSLTEDADSQSLAPSISETGRYVAFMSTADNIPTSADPDGNSAGDTELFSIYICDRDPGDTGTFDHTLDGSMDYQYTLVGTTNTDDFDPTISAAGTTIAWTEFSFSDDGTETQNVVYSHLTMNSQGDILTPADSDITTVVTSDPQHPGDQTNEGRVSADGQHVVFLTVCAGCPAVEEEQAPTIVDIENIDFTDPGRSTTTRVDLDTGGDPLVGTPEAPTVSGNGDEVAWEEIADDDGATPDQIIAASPGDPSTETVVSKTTAGATGQGDQPALSTDGRYIAFQTSAAGMSNGVDITSGAGEGYGYGDEGGREVQQIVVRDLVVDASRQARRLPRLPAELASPSISRQCEENLPADATCGGDGDSLAAALDDTGGVVAYESDADDLVPGDTNLSQDAFARLFQPTVTGNGLNFGTVPDTETSTETVTVAEAGFGPVQVTNVTITGSNGRTSTVFTVFPTQNCTNATLREFDTCLISIRFAPTTLGTLTGQLTLTLGDGAPPVVIALTGVGGPKPVITNPVGTFQANPNPVRFPGPSLALSRSAPQVITVTDHADGPLTIHTVTVLTGPNLVPGDYTIGTDTCQNTVLRPGGTCQVSVTDTPHGSGSRPGALEFTDTAGNSPQLIGLSSTGAAATVRVSPAVVIAGRVTTVSGTGWPASAHMILTIPELTGGDTVSVATKPDGTFSTPLVVFAHAEVGEWSVNGTASGTTLQATTPLLVVLGTYQPPGFTSREGD